MLEGVLKCARAAHSMHSFEHTCHPSPGLSPSTQGVKGWSQLLDLNRRPTVYKSSFSASAKCAILRLIIYHQALAAVLLGMAYSRENAGIRSSDVAFCCTGLLQHVARNRWLLGVLMRLGVDAIPVGLRMLPVSGALAGLRSLFRGKARTGEDQRDGSSAVSAVDMEIRVEREDPRIGMNFGHPHQARVSQ